MRTQTPTLNPAGESLLSRISLVINQILKGRLNNVIPDVTLRANEATTVITDPRLGADSFLDFMATTANAAAVKASIYVTDRGTGTATVNHTNSGTADKTFDVQIG